MKGKTVSDISTIFDIQKLSDLLVGYLPNLFSALVLVVLFWIGNRLAVKTLETTFSRMKIDPQAAALLVRGASAGIFVFALLTVADQLQINIKSLLAGVGVMGLAISFAAKDTVSNIISGVVLIIDRPFRQGDWIALGDIHATVSQIRLRTTVLTTFDNETVVVPNQKISQERIINYTLTPKIRVKVSVGIAYKEDIATVKAILLDLVKGDDRILPDPAPNVVLTGLDASSVNLQLRFWIENPSDKFSFQSGYTEKAKNALDRAGIEIPFPHLQLFVEDSKGVRVLASGKSSDGAGPEKG